MQLLHPKIFACINEFTIIASTGSPEKVRLPFQIEITYNFIEFSAHTTNFHILVSTGEGGWARDNNKMYNMKRMYNISHYD